MNNEFLSAFKTLYTTFFTDTETIKIITFVNKSNIVLSDTNYSALINAFDTLTDTTEQFRKDAMIDMVKKAFVEGLDLYMIKSYIGVDLKLKIAMEDGDDWTAYSVVSEVFISDTAVVPIGTTATGILYNPNIPYQTIVIADIGQDYTLAKNTLHKLVVYLFQGDITNAAIVVGTFYLVLYQTADEVAP